ncbi:MAG: hypothetical protein WKF94_14250 [Solirubrobacteraceae bacterium]
MANGKKKTTMAKLNRETRMRERKHEKEARKAERKRAAADGTDETSDRPAWLGDPVEIETVTTPSE